MLQRAFSFCIEMMNACREKLRRPLRRLNRLFLRDLPRECTPKIRKAFSFAKKLANHYWQIVRNFLDSQWQIWQPKIVRLKNATIAITTATTTLKLSIETTPIIFSMLTVLATVPLLGFILPSFLFEPAILFPLIFAISIYIGYYKYLELMERAKLDHQITTNQSKINTLFKKIDRLEKRLDKYHPEPPDSLHRQYKPTVTRARQRYKPTVHIASSSKTLFKPTVRLEKELNSSSQRKTIRN